MATEFNYPTDRGFVVMRTMDDGTKRVMVCDGVVGGEPKNVYAMHFRCTSVRVHPGVKMVNTKTTSYTKHIVEVSAESPGVVHLSAIRQGMSPVLDAEARAR
jgi:hypothetical protein